MVKISQREAIRLRKQVRELLRQLDGLRRGWARDYPGVHLAIWRKGEILDAAAVITVRTARRLGHATVLVDNGDELYIFGVK